MSSKNIKIDPINTLPKALKYPAKFVRHQEQAAGLSGGGFGKEKERFYGSLCKRFSPERCDTGADV